MSFTRCHNEWKLERKLRSFFPNRHVTGRIKNALMLEFPIDAMALPGVSPESLAAEAKFMLALKLYEVGRLSSGKAGKLCGMGRVEFLFTAGRAGVPVVALDGHEF